MHWKVYFTPRSPCPGLKPPPSMILWPRPCLCPYDQWFTNKAYLSPITVITSQSFTYKMAAKINWHRYGTIITLLWPYVLINCPPIVLTMFRSSKKGPFISRPDLVVSDQTWHSMALRSNGLCRLCIAQGPGGKEAPLRGLQLESVFCFTDTECSKINWNLRFSTRTHSTVVLALKEAEWLKCWFSNQPAWK